MTHVPASAAGRPLANSGALQLDANASLSSEASAATARLDEPLPNPPTPETEKPEGGSSSTVSEDVRAAPKGANETLP